MIGYYYYRNGGKYFTPSQKLAFLRATQKVSEISKNGLETIIWEWEERTNEIIIINL